MRILIIDDEENVRRTTSVALESMGHHSTGAESARAARQHLAVTSFDVVLLDLKLNGDCGLELLSELVNIKPQPSVICFTANASLGTASEAMRSGAADYVLKPFTLDHLRRVLSRLDSPPDLIGSMSFPGPRHESPLFAANTNAPIFPERQPGNRLITTPALESLVAPTLGRD